MAASVRRILLALLPLLLLATPARAASGEGAGFGPVIGLTWNGSVSVGWEASASLGIPLARFAAGGSYQLRSSSSKDARYFHYLAWEPWLFVGATVGLALTDEPQAKVLYGAWAGWAQDAGDALFDGNSDFLDDDTRFHWVFSLSVGWRGFGSTQQFYLTPKLWRIQGWDFFT
ncbi:MAG: hypothetical protein RL685_678 [Pseudomonadota bacterium]|jgi:hypothetical protein